MKIWPHILEHHGVYARHELCDGFFLDPMKKLHEDMDTSLVSEVDHDSDLTAYTAYIADEISDDEDDAPTGAVMEILFSKRKKLAALRYDNPSLSGAFIEWVSCDSPEKALVEWRKKVVAKYTVIRGDISQIVIQRSAL
ncbi:hypothetical protein HRR99_05830 [Agrobacterium vaccinii]|uniref:hypothetical protein n=1 Tax=Agrobacterium vaccinii TaxID=2735528 RepID=UPI001E3B0AA8|nr:hypothetical protein [Agrobacterium vaccinii]UHS61067.1 hypothetical protein HRR99_05830 [Agrobacterium vaccinii]